MSDRPRTPSVHPYLTVSNGTAAVDFYKQAFGAEELMRMPADDGKRLLHAQLKINGGVVMLSDDFPEMKGGQSSAPDPKHPQSVTIHLEVTDADAVYDRAIAAGATAIMPPADMFWGDRYGKLRDPFGHEWAMTGPLKGK